MNLNDVTQVYVENLLDDMLDNTERHLYEFVGGDYCKAFFITLNFQDWEKYLEPYQVRLYSREIRNAPELFTPYESQYNYWSKKYYETNKNKQVLITDFPQYVLSNWIPSKNEDKKVKVTLAIVLALQMITSKDNQSKKRRGRPPKKQTQDA